MAYRKEELTFYAYTNIKYIVLFLGEQYFHYICRKTKPHLWGTADIFRGIMVSLYVKGKENSYYVCNREPTEVLIDTLWSLDFFAFRDAMNLSASLREPSHLSMR